MINYEEKRGSESRTGENALVGLQRSWPWLWATARAAAKLQLALAENRCRSANISCSIFLFPFRLRRARAHATWDKCNSDGRKSWVSRELLLSLTSGSTWDNEETSSLLTFRPIAKSPVDDFTLPCAIQLTRKRAHIYTSPEVLVQEAFALVSIVTDFCGSVAVSNIYLIIKKLLSILLLVSANSAHKRL